jgi:hypothetical protein
MSIILDGNIGLTYPDVTTQNTSAIISGKLPTARLPAGAVLQVVHGLVGGPTVTTSGGTLIDTGLTATITPTSSTSKILILFCHWECYVAASQAAPQIALFRNSTKLGDFDDATIGYVSTGGSNYFNVNGQFYDSPATTSAIVYKTQFKAYNGTVSVQGDSTNSYITLMEIAA